MFNDTNLPEGVCDDINEAIRPCVTNLASTWAVGGDDVSFLNESFVRKKYLV